MNAPGFSFLREMMENTLFGGLSASDSGAASDGDLVHDCLGEFFSEGWIIFHGLFGRVAALADKLALEGYPCPFLFQNFVFDAEVDDRAGL